jgi:hypothetical protein
MHRPATTRAGDIFGFDDDLDPRQMLGKRAASGTPLLRQGALQRRLGLLLFGLALGHRLFEVFQRQVELVGIEPFRAPAKLHPLQLADQVAPSVVLAGELIALFQEPPLLRPLGIALGPRRQHQRAQRRDGVRKGLLLRHARHYPMAAAPSPATAG